MASHAARLNAALKGRYRIERELGEGGMATVFLAHDERHDRSVALKVLKTELAAVVGAERFLAEIKTTANLQHPHILPLFDSGEADSFLFFVMPYVEGESLRNRLDREGELPVEEAVRIATAVASALDYAHRHGVIHRDIKPANILLHEGQPLVADFGIALALSAAGGGRLTETGMSLGTPYYMSPEQATADRDPDPRSDVYALGCVLYEMLVGEPPYTGASAQAVLGKILTAEPVRPTEHRRATPPHVESAVLRALERRPADRFGTAADMGAALSDAQFRHAPGTHTSPERSSRTWSLADIPTWLMAATVILFLAASGAAFLGGRTSGSTLGDGVTRLSIALPPGHAVTSAPAISPDGKTVAFTSGPASEPPQLYTRELDSFDLTLVPGSVDAHSPFFSPDGQSIAFFASGRLFRWNRGGGRPQPIAEAPAQMGGTWGEDGTIVFVPNWNGGLYLLDPSERLSEPVELLVPDGVEEYAHVFPRFVPGHQEILFTSWGAEAALWRLDLATGERSSIAPRANSGTQTRSGVVLFSIDELAQPLLAMPGDADFASLSSQPEVLSGVHQRTWSPDLWVSVSHGGDLAYVPSNMAAQSLVLLDATGASVSIGVVGGVYGSPSLSPDGRRVAVDVSGKVWIYDLDGGAARIAPENRDWGELNPVWAPDGSRVFYSSNASGNWELYSRTPGAPASEIVLEKADDQNFESVSREGMMSIRESHPITGDDLWLMQPGAEPTPWQVTPHVEAQSDFSPDGKWLAYSTNLSGQKEIWVGAVEGSERRIQVTTEGGQAPVWSPRGDRLFYRRFSALMAVDVLSLDPPTFGRPERVFDGGWSTPISTESFITPYDVTSGGEHFIMIRHEQAAIPDRINIVLGWFDELDRLLSGS